MHNQTPLVGQTIITYKDNKPKDEYIDFFEKLELIDTDELIAWRCIKSLDDEEEVAMPTFDVTWNIPSANELDSIFSMDWVEKYRKDKRIPEFIADAIFDGELVLIRNGKHGIGFVHQSVENDMMFDARPFLKPGQVIVDLSNDDPYKDNLAIYDGDDD